MPASNTKSVQISIGAIDRVTGVVRSINGRLNALVAPVTRANNSFRKLGDEFRGSHIVQAFAGVSSQVGNTFSEASKLALKLSALGGAGAFAAYQLFHGFGESTAKVKDTAEALGLTTKRVQELVGGAKLAGVEEGAFVSGIDRFNRNIAEAAAGSSEAMSGFHALGLSVTDSRGKLKTLDDLLPLVADKLARIQNASVRNAVGVRIFGKGFKDLYPFLADGAKGMDVFQQKFVELGGVLSDKDVAGGDAFLKLWTRLEVVFNSVRNAIASALLPVVSELGEKLQRFVVENRAQIVEWVQAFARDLPGMLSRAAAVAKALFEAFRPILAILRLVTEHFGLLQTILTVVGAILSAKLVVAIVGLVASIAPLIGYVFSLFSAFKVVFDIVSALVLLFGAGPVALVIGAVAAIAGAAALIYKYWGPIKDFFANLWSGVVSGISSAAGAIRGALGLAAPALAPAGGTAQLAPAMGAGGILGGAFTQTQVSRQEATVRLDLGQLPPGSRVTSDAGGVPLDLAYGIGMGGPL